MFYINDMNTATYTCPKCNGLGALSQYRGILGGVCFSCEGTGRKVGVAPVAGVLFAVSAVRKADGARVVAFNVKAKTAEAALKSAIKTFSRGNGFIPESAQVAA